jgi:hypothetical protein
VPIADYLVGAFRATRMADTDKSGQSTSIKSDTACRSDASYNNLDVKIRWLTSLYRNEVFISTPNGIV